MQNRARSREIQALVSIVAKIIRNAMDERLAAQDIGITGLQYGILQIIHKGPQTMTEISRVQMIDPSTLVASVDSLERKGLARRIKDPKDRRRTPLKITAAGLALLTRIPVLHEEDALVKGLAEMNPDHQDQLLILLSKFHGDEAVQRLTAIIQAEMKDQESG
jgi:DNA-binding MarR family transcriptional regulator